MLFACIRNIFCETVKMEFLNILLFCALFALPYSNGKYLFLFNLKQY